MEKNDLSSIQKIWILGLLIRNDGSIEQQSLFLSFYCGVLVNPKQSKSFPQVH